MSVGNLYHMLCHRRIHFEMEKNVNKLPLAIGRNPTKALNNKWCFATPALPQSV